MRLLILILMVLVSCSKKSNSIQPQQDSTSNYVQYVSNSRTSSTEVKLNMNVYGISAIYELHIYQYQRLYQYNIPIQSGLQSVNDYLLQPNQPNQKYYFQVILKNLDTLKGNVFTVNF